MPVSKNSADLNLPLSWLALLSGYASQTVEIGQSIAGVLRLEAPGKPSLFVKYEPLETPLELAEMSGEVERLNWLKGQDVPSPEVLDFLVEEGNRWLLMSALPGHDLVLDMSLADADRIGIVATTLKRLHEIDPATCPFDERLEIKIGQAEARVKGGYVDETDFDAEYRGMTAPELFEKLVAAQPVEDRLVVCHGDPCLPNLISKNAALTGIIDCGRLGVADPAKDIAIAARSIEYNIGQVWRDEFLSAFGYTAEDDHLGYYRLLDEFF